MFYLALVPPTVFVFFSNMYWLFPLKGDRPFFDTRIILRLLLSTLTIVFICTLLMMMLHMVWFANFFVVWATQLFLVTPASWLIYRQQKDKILQLRGTQEKLARSTADIQFLRSQINPHFLFNALNTLYATALKEHAQHTAEGIQKLGDMMRFMLHENTRDLIPLSREIEYLGNYIALQKMRIQSSPNITIKDNINQLHWGHSIAPMLLIPFVENAFKHGISLKERSWIYIKLDGNELMLHFEVRNSIHARAGKDPEQEGSGIGLQNVSERLQILYPGRHVLNTRIEDNEFVAELTIQP
jgi:two-component system LytT family sensor kinase